LEEAGVVNALSKSKSGTNTKNGSKVSAAGSKKKKNSCIVGVSLNKEKIKTKCKGMLITAYSKTQHMKYLTK
jgi:hypothetical protein